MVMVESVEKMGVVDNGNYLKQNLKCWGRKILECLFFESGVMGVVVLSVGEMKSRMNCINDEDDERGSSGDGEKGKLVGFRYLH